MSASLHLMKWLLKTMKIKESYDRPIAEIEAAKKKRNSKMSFSLKPLSGQTLEMCDWGQAPQSGTRAVPGGVAEGVRAFFKERHSFFVPAGSL